MKNSKEFHYVKKKVKNFKNQRKRMHYKNKLNESNTVRLFVYNVPREYTVDNVYRHFNYLDIDVKDLWQRLHPDARKKSFVTILPNNV